MVKAKASLLYLRRVCGVVSATNTVPQQEVNFVSTARDKSTRSPHWDNIWISKRQFLLQRADISLGTGTHSFRWEEDTERERDLLNSLMST